MNTICSLLIISLFINGVFGDTVTVNEGGSVTLHTRTGIWSYDDVIEWRFKGDLIVRHRINRPFYYREITSEPVYEPDERFTDRLKMNPQTGDLTVTNITSEHTGLYQLYIISGKRGGGHYSSFSTFSVSVFGDTVTVNEGGSVTLHTRTGIWSYDDVIEWRFKGDLIVRHRINRPFYYREITSEPVYEPDERFTDRLKMNPQTGDLTVTNITSEHTGLYQLYIISGKRGGGHYSSFSTFSVSLSPEVKIVKERDSVTLHVDVPDRQRNDQIHWKIKHNNSPVAEIIRENGKISTHLIEERFRDRLKLDDQTGSLTITHMKNEDSGPYEADVTIGRITHTIHKTFSVTDSGVFGDTVSVNDGDSVTLHTHLTDIQRDDVIKWWFKDDLIARINREVNNSDPVYEPDERFTDRLKMNPQTGDLTITDITSQHTGLYQLEIVSKRTETKLQTFSVSLSPEVKIVKERDSVTLHFDVFDLQRNDQIHWKIKHNNSPVAEIIIVNGKISTHLIDERFRDRLKLDDQTGSLTITHMKNEDSGPYEADVTIGRITHTIHKTFSVTDSGVFGDTVSVNDGDSVTLHTHLTDIQRDDVIKWWFKDDLIARINREVNNSDPVYEPDERFTDRLKMNPQTGDLTITDITSQHTGLYQLEIVSKRTETKLQTFSVSLSPEVKIVKERDSVDLHIDIPDKQRNDQIHWKIKHNNSPVAEIITVNGKISTPFINERFRDRLKLDDQTGSLTITHMKNEDSGQYEVNVTIGHTHTIHKTFSVTDSGVFGDETDTVSVNDGGSVTLHNPFTDIQTDDLILWRFRGVRIAKVNRAAYSDPVYDPAERFTDRLKMNPQTADLTITNITSEHTGLYQLEIVSKRTETKFQTFSVSLSPKLKIVKERDSITLHIDIPEEQRNEKIHWKIKHNKSPVAEIITVNGKISTPFIEERFRDRLKLDDQTGSLTITHMKNEDSGPYEADVTIGHTHTIHKTFSVTDSGHSSGVIPVMCVSLLLLVIAAVVGVVIYRRRIMRHRDSNRGEASMETNEPLRNRDASNGDVPSV
ncbi:uncharacterized protein LOC130548461 isoform X2 [Triplophysa rosa]|uniref:uncharacterized protein LOC130548461 isoform X2 n=1 Tax=Triplophysa rosa TaxID=992332 RepID=UPI002546387E|nr:uncharacterized protein LOC130548461 isoform X2 [Triplophysa rosa]